MCGYETELSIFTYRSGAVRTARKCTSSVILGSPGPTAKLLPTAPTKVELPPLLSRRLPKNEREQHAREGKARAEEKEKKCWLLNVGCWILTVGCWQDEKKNFTSYILLWVIRCNVTYVVSITRRGFKGWICRPPEPWGGFQKNYLQNFKVSK